MYVVTFIYISSNKGTKTHIEVKQSHMQVPPSGNVFQVKNNALNFINNFEQGATFQWVFQHWIYVQKWHATAFFFFFFFSFLFPQSVTVKREES